MNTVAVIPTKLPFLVKVAANSRPTAVAGAIAGMIREGKKPIVQAIGTRAVNQAPRR